MVAQLAQLEHDHDPTTPDYQLCLMTNIVMTTTNNINIQKIYRIQPEYQNNIKLETQTE